MKAHLSILIIFFLGNTLFLYSQEENPSQVTNTLPNKGICAHRGASNTHPENTIVAFKKAIRLGAEMIEFDVRMTKDKKLVIIHDTSIDRTTNGTGLVSDLSLHEIQSLDAGAWKDEKFIGEKVPTLKETLNTMPKNIWLNIHLKGSESLGAATAKILKESDRMHQGVIACGYDALKGVRKISASIIICNMERASDRTAYIDATIQNGSHFIQLQSSRNSNYDQLERDIKKLKQNNIFINYYHAETEKEMQKLLNLGIDFILTNHLAIRKNNTNQ